MPNLTFASLLRRSYILSNGRPSVSVSNSELSTTRPHLRALRSSNVRTHGTDANSDAGVYSDTGSISAKYELFSLAKLPISRSPCITIPLVISLLSFLESPILVSNIKVHDVSDSTVRRLGVDALPAVVGWLSNGEKHILKTGISVKDMKSAVQDLGALLDSFDKKNKRAASNQAKKAQDESGSKQIPLLAASNFDALCGETTPVCIIGAFRSSRAKDTLEKILSEART